MFITDRDLLILEPALFRDCAPAGQRLLSGTCTISGNTLTFETRDLSPEAADITAGHVILVDAVPYEVIERTGEDTLTISRLRAGAAADIQPPPPVTLRPAHIYTFAPQIAAAHGQLLDMFGILPAASALPDAVTESDITNPGELKLVESLAALHLIFQAAEAPTTNGIHNSSRAAHYLRRFAAERHRAAARVDLDGDGQPDAKRYATFLHLTR
jgi:hypothetical protein